MFSVSNSIKKNVVFISQMLSLRYCKFITRRATTALSTKVQTKAAIGYKSEKIFERENKFGAHNYQPVPVALTSGKGMK